MSAIAFDTLKCARRLKAAGYTDKQAEAQAEIMAEAFVFNMDSLVTRDYLDARLAEQEARIDTRFAEQDARVDARFVEQDVRIDARFSAIDLKLEGINGQFRLVYWMLAVVIASTVIPAIQQLYSLI